MNKIVVVEILSCKKHPQAQRLQICEVSDGKSQVKVVCGATNAKSGLKTLLAPVGSKTPGGRTIEKVTMRGEDSYGMLCSPKDLEVSLESGIIDLPQNSVLGTEWTALDPDHLSSTPWHQLKLVESFWVNTKTQKITVQESTTAPTDAQYELLSRTYFDGTKYLYRNN